VTLVRASLGERGVGATSPIARINYIVPGAPDGDVLRVEPAPLALLTIATGGPRVMSLCSATGLGRSPVGAPTFRDWSYPRVARSEHGEPTVTAIADEEQVVAFTQSADGEWREWSPGVSARAARLVVDRDGWVLVYKRDAPGRVPQLRGMLGTLWAVRLDRDHRVMSPAVSLLEGLEVYDFDAAAKDDQLAVVGVTADGVAFRCGPLRGTAARADFPQAAAVHSPAVAIVDGRVFATALRAPRTPAAKLLVGVARLPPP
jgi:hypothetical protein